MERFMKLSLLLAVIAAVLLQLPIIRTTITVVSLGLAIGKTIQSISEFPYQCQRIHNPRLQACEDMWLSEPTRQLFLGCSDPLARSRWGPNEGHFNISGRSTRDAIVVMDLETLGVQELSTNGYFGAQGDTLIHLNGFTGIRTEDGSIELLLTNFRPSVHASTRQVLPDQAATGANATIERFRVLSQENKLEHLETFFDQAIATPNRVAAVAGSGFYITNDHGLRKTGLLSQLSPLLGSGNVAFCPQTPSDACNVVSTGHHYPNGLLYDPLDQRLYVPSSAAGGIKVYDTHQNGSVTLAAEIDLPYAIDNLSLDQNGHLWAAVITRGIEFLKHATSPLDAKVPAASVFRIARAAGTYEAVKVLEDGEGERLPGATTVVHDAVTGRLFLSGAFSPFITVCEPK